METYKLAPQIKALGNIQGTKAIVTGKFWDLAYWPNRDATGKDWLKPTQKKGEMCMTLTFVSIDV